MECLPESGMQTKRELRNPIFYHSYLPGDIMMTKSLSGNFLRILCNVFYVYLIIQMYDKRCALKTYLAV